MREQCKNCKYYHEEPHIMLDKCRHFNSTLIPGWYEVYEDGNCPEFKDKQEWIDDIIRVLKENGIEI